jgi:hypothetical protein
MAEARPLLEEPTEPKRPKVQPTLSQFEAIWPALFAGLRDLLGARRWALFRETEPAAVEGSTLIGGVKHDFHLKALVGDAAVSKIVATRAGDLLGGDVAVRFLPVEGAGAAPAVDQSEESFDDQRVDREDLAEAPSDATDPLRLLEEQLGGKVVDEFEADQDE